MYLKFTSPRLVITQRSHLCCLKAKIDDNKLVLTILTLDGGFLVLTQKPSLARVGWTGREKKKPRRSGQKPTWQPTMPHSQMLGTTVIKC